MRLQPDGTPGMVRIYWAGVPGALGYDMISGDLTFQIFCYDGTGAATNSSTSVRAVKIRVQTEGGAAGTTAGIQKAIFEDQVRLRNL